MPKQNKADGRDSAAEAARRIADAAEEAARTLAPPERPGRRPNADDPGMELT